MLHGGFLLQFFARLFELPDQPASGWSEVMRVLRASGKLLEDTLNGDAESVAAAFDQAHTELSSILTYNGSMRTTGSLTGICWQVH